MKHRQFTFAACYAGLHKAGVKAILVLTGSQKKASKPSRRLRQYVKQSLQGTALSRTGAAACVAITLGLPAMAQQPCNTFQNADAANAIVSLLHGFESIHSLDFVDIDNDGDLDCYAQVYSYYSFPVLFRNTGSATKPVFVRDAGNGFQNTTNSVPSSTDVQFADIDGDGDYDCFIGEAYTFGGTTIHYFENTGTREQPVFVSNEANNPLSFAYGFYGIGFTLADIDGDGDLDAAISPQFGFFGQTIFRNIGTPTQPRFNNGKRDTDRGSSHFRIYYDWNKDGLMDFFDDALYYRNIGPRQNPVYVLDSTGPRFENGTPYRFADLNNDGAIEQYDYFGHYSTLAPVAVIRSKPAQNGGFSYTLLTSANQQPGYAYQWQLNGKDIAKATRASYYAVRKGTYTLLVTGACGTGVSLPYVMTANAGAQSSDALIANAAAGSRASVLVQASPNPFTSTFTVKLAQPVPGGSAITVCDLQGRVLLIKYTTGTVVQVGETLKRGMYIVQVWQKDGLVFSTKAIKE